MYDKRDKTMWHLTLTIGSLRAFVSKQEQDELLLFYELALFYFIYCIQIVVVVVVAVAVADFVDLDL